MKKGIHFLYGQKNTGERSLRETVEHLAGLGCELIEVPPEDFLAGRDDAAEFVKFARDHGADIAFCCGLPPSCDLASPDAAVREAGVAYVHGIIRLMERADMHLMTGTSWTVWPSPGSGPLTAAERERTQERTAKAYARAIAPIEGCGIRSAIEPMNRFENHLVNTSGEGVHFCELVGNGNLGLLLDVFHMSIEETSIEDAILTAGPRLFHLHLAERNRALPGMGKLDWAGLFTALKKVRYAGCLGIESFIVPEGDIAASVALWRDLSGGASGSRLDEMLKESLAFLDNMSNNYLE